MRSFASGTSTPWSSGASPTTGQLRVLHGGEVVAEMPNAALTDEAPRYDRPRAPGEAREAEDVEAEDSGRAPRS